MRILFSILFLPFFGIGQTTFTGTVSGKNSLDNVPYATVGLMKENIGVNADEKGYFILKSVSPKSNDTLMISSVGFMTQKIPITNNSDTNINIQLTRQIATLDEIFVVPNYQWTSARLNDFPDCGNEFVTSSGYLQQVAQHFIAPHENSRLTKVKICRVPGKPKKTIFRIRVYDIDTLTGGPGEDLCDKIIEVKSKSSVVNVNVEEYKLRIPHRDFFVAIEWLKIPGNEQDIKRTNNNTGIDYRMYSPGIGWKDLNDSNPEAWQLNYSGIWRPFSYSFRSKKSLFISTIIKY